MAPKKDEPASGVRQSGQEITAEELAKLKPIDLAPVYAGSFNIQGTGNDFTLIFQRPRPMVDQMGGLHPGIAINETVAIVGMSPQALKDLWTLIGFQLENHEKEYGKIETDYTRRIKKTN